MHNILSLSCRFVDWLERALNDDLPDEQWRMPEPHPAGVRPGTIDDSNADYHKLVNTVERHTRCSPAYCLSQKHFDAPAECKFGFPKDL